MYLAQLKEYFYQEIFPSEPQDWEVEQALEPMLKLNADQQRALLSHVHAVWPVSHSLCLSYIYYGAQYIRRLMGEDLAEWVRQCLSHYEQEGLREARLFMAELDDKFYARLTGLDGVHYEQVQGKLLNFIRGVSGIELQLAPLQGGSDPWTDGETIHLPQVVNHFPEQSDNELFYTFLACCQWGYLSLGSLQLELQQIREEADGSISSHVEECLASYDDPVLAGNIFHFLEFVRVFTMLSKELPGLVRSARPLLQYLVCSRQQQSVSFARGIYYSRLLALVSDRGEAMAAREKSGPYPQLREDTFKLLPIYYGEIESLLASGCYDDWQLFVDFTGRLCFDKVRDHIRRKRAEQKQLFIDQLTAIISNHLLDDERSNVDNGTAKGSGSESADSGRLMVRITQGDDDNNTGQVLTINNELVEMPADFNELVASISNDLGHVPEGYVQAAVGVAGRAVFTSGGQQEGQALQSKAAQVHLYDEWDFRRQGYRKNWCALVEKEIQPVRSPFVERTLVRYRGQIRQLRRQFEMLRIEHKFVRRRRHGDDIDFDAVVEAKGDQLAGLAPSDRLFIRLLRDDRDIAVMFLVDMSNSTEGWVGTAIKESLVLLSDVLEIVGDRYAIYGFSGMRRSRCELFRIKKMDEAYGPDVAQRICGISPREYTRMAPAIRHLTTSLVGTDAKVRLLITLTDGKPEDYDDYRGEYAIEDTRQALLEARGKGVHTFSITVDRHAHSYLSHMCGRHNSIFVDKVEQLPQRLPEIYRLMTS